MEMDADWPHEAASVDKRAPGVAFFFSPDATSVRVAVSSSTGTIKAAIFTPPKTAPRAYSRPGRGRLPKSDRLLVQQGQRGCHDLRQKSHLDMRCTAHQPVVGPWQGGGRGRKHDVVAVGIPAGEQRMAVGGNVVVQLRLPARQQAHLLAIVAEA